MRHSKYILASLLAFLFVFVSQAEALRPRYKVARVNTTRPVFERLVHGLAPTMDIRPGKSTTTDLESIRVNQIDSTVGSVSFTQSIDANKPLLTEGGRRENLQPNSEDVSAWGTPYESTISDNSATPPSPYTNADAIIESTNNDIHYQFFDTTTIAGIVYKIYVVAKTNGRNIRISLDSSDYGANKGAIFNLTTGAVTSEDASNEGAEVEDLGDGWYRLSLTATAANTSTTSRVFVWTIQGTSTTTYAGDGTSGVHVTGAQHQRASMNPTYIPTNALPRHGSLTGQRGLYADGSNDTLSSTSDYGDIATVSAYTAFHVLEPYDVTDSGIWLNAQARHEMRTISSTFRAKNYDGSSDLASITATNAPYVLSSRLDGGVLYFTDGRASNSASTASGNTDRDTDTLTYLSDGAGTAFIGVSHREVYFDKVIPTSTRQRLMKGFKRFYRIN